jgi:hypothetical protein
MTTFLDIVKTGLKASGFDGLCYLDGEEPCGCSLDELAPCGSFDGNCTPGYLQPRDRNGCDYLIEPENRKRRPVMVQQTLTWIIVHVFGRCLHCGAWFVYPPVRRRSTRYANDESNFVQMCDLCFDQQEALWKEMWSEYYSGLL